MIWDPERNRNQRTKTERSGDERKTFVDVEKQISVFCLENGKWAGQIWVARLQCCENPYCDCASVDFCCAQYKGPENAPVLPFAMNPFKRRIAPSADRDRPPESAGLAKGLVAEMGEDEWK